MSKNAVAQFFADAYKDKKLQGALHYALAKSTPDVVVEIAKEKGYSFTKEDLGSVVEAGSGEVSGFLLASQLSSQSLRTNFWSSLRRFGGADAGFGLTIPGPSFVHQSCDDLDRAKPEEEPVSSTPSAVELYRSLTAEEG